MVQVIHALNGRARFKVKGLYGSERLGTEIFASLSGREGIKSVYVNTVTGNVLVYYNSCNSPRAIATAITAITSVRNGRGPAPGLQPAREPCKVKASKKKAVKKNRSGKALQGAALQPVEEWHLLAPEDALKAITGKSSYGLSSMEALEGLKRWGSNILSEAVPRSGLNIFFGQFNSLPVALLGTAAGISIFTGGVADALVIAGVMCINAAIGYVTESRAERTISSLKSLVRPTAHVLRDEIVREAPADEVVPGDILVLRPGSYIAADARLIEAHRLSVDESALTGESMPSVKMTGALASSDVPLADRKNMLYMGTLVTGGQGLAIVVATGQATEISRIQALVLEAEPPETPMQRQLSKMGTQLVLISGGVCGLVFVIGIIRGYGFLAMLKTSISLAVAAVPEGLPTIATTTLALGISNMKGKKVLMRHLDAVETLGSVQAICLDKTGTITVNRMTVVALHTGLKRIAVRDGIFESREGKINPYSCDELLRLLHVAALCNESEAVSEGNGYALNGSATENALLQMVISSGVDIGMLREKYQLEKISHRAEDRNYMATVHRFQKLGNLIAVKGSPSEVLSMCSSFVRDSMTFQITEEDKLKIETANEVMAGEALRVLGVAYIVREGGGIPKSGLTWLGLIGMADPVRKGVKDAIGSFHRAGIETIMITGDQSPTAYAIGKELELSGNAHLEILDSTHLSNMDPEVLAALSGKVHIFSRVSPANKLQIVQSLQRSGKVVAMTGDGINDSPALRAADIGIAMGHTGTDVAREVADMVLEDDNIETMIIAVSQGRTIYNNIRKSVRFLLSTNLSEIMVMFTSMAGGLGAPLNAMQLLWINLVSDIAPGLALALEPAEPDVLSRPPRDPHEPIIRNSDFKRIFFESGVLSAGALGAYGYGIARYGAGPRAGTLAFLSLSTAQIIHSISSRSEGPVLFGRERMPPNRYLDLAVGGSLLVQALVVLSPGLRGLLGLTRLSLADGLVIGTGALAPLLLNEVTKKETNG